MKRYIAILAAALLLACTACGKKQAPSDTLDSKRGWLRPPRRR